MALIKCPNCKKEISEKAINCPHCGSKLKNDLSLEEKNVMRLMKIADNLKIILIICAIICFFGGMVNENDILVFYAILCLIMCYCVPAFIENKAFILKNVYELNERGKK